MASISNNESGLSVRTKLNTSIAAQEANTAKLSGIEDGAEVNPSASEIKTSYESNANTNAFTDAEQTKLGTVEDNAKDNLIRSALGGQLDLVGVAITEIFSNYEGNTSISRTGIGTYEITNDSGSFTVETILRVHPDAACFWSHTNSAGVLTLTVADTSGTPADNLIADGKIEIVNYR